jgi:hypothetical protein
VVEVLCRRSAPRRVPRLDHDDAPAGLEAPHAFGEESPRRRDVVEDVGHRDGA